MTDGRCPYCYGYLNSAAKCGTASCPSYVYNIPAVVIPVDFRDAALAALRERLAAAEALSESRRVTLLAKSEELAAEWKRAETAEALVRELAAVAKAARTTVHVVSEWCGNAGCEGGTPDGSCEDYKPHDLCDPCTVGKPLMALDRALAALSDAARKEIER